VGAGADGLAASTTQSPATTATDKTADPSHKAFLFMVFTIIHQGHGSATAGGFTG